MKRTKYFFIVALLLVGLTFPVHAEVPRDVLFQVSTLDALLAGIYDGEMTYGELEEHGGFGLGTFNQLDGEMVALDGEFYQVKEDGAAYPVPDSARTPFAVVTFFEPDQELSVTGPVDYEGLKRELDDSLPTKNIFYALRIEGEFDYLKVRSVPKQTKPYKPLS